MTRKRVTLVYRPHDPVTAAQVADTDVLTAIGRAGARAGETKATESAELAAARQAAQEEAAGAGMERFSMLVTATVDDPAQLPEAARAVDRMGWVSRVTLRRCYGCAVRGVCRRPWSGRRPAQPRERPSRAPGADVSAQTTLTARGYRGPGGGRVFLRRGPT